MEKGQSEKGDKYKSRLSPSVKYHYLYLYVLYWVSKVKDAQFIMIAVGTIGYV